MPARPRLLELETRTTPAYTITDTPATLTFVSDGADQSLTVFQTATDVRAFVDGSLVVLTNARPDTLTRIVVRGGAGAELIDLTGVGTNANVFLGADVTAAGGADTVFGGPGDDTLDGGAGEDQLAGGPGDDLFRTRDDTADTLDGGLGRDTGVIESEDLPVNCEVWNPFEPAADNQPHKVKVLVLNFDPLIPSQDNRHLWEVFNWSNPADNARNYVEARERISGGYVDYEIADWRNLNEIPPLDDGYQYGAEEYYAARAAIAQGTPWQQTVYGQHQTAHIDYTRVLTVQRVPEAVDAGLVDEVWVFGDHYFNGWEWAMAGPGAFFINGGVYPQVPSARPFPVMGASYERGIDVALHDHRFEATMNRFYGGWNLANPQTNWDKFSANAHQSNGESGVGTIHYPANGQGDYDYANPRTVASYADAFLDYPAVDWATKPVDRETWGHLGPDENQPGLDYQHDYFQWYFSHVPRAAGVNPDGRQNNWWKYAVDFNNYNANGSPRPFRAVPAAPDLYTLGGPAYTFRVAYSSPVPVVVASLGTGDLRVTGPNGFDQLAGLVSVSDAADGTYRVATYRVTAPGGAWDATEMGRYTLALLADQVTDALGNALAAQVLGVFQVRTTDPGELPNDADTSLLLRLDGSAAGVAGETPTGTSSLTFGPGLVGSAGVLDGGGNARYTQAGNLTGARGTVEFWVRPSWNGDLNQTHYFFHAGANFNNGMLLAIDGANNLRLIQWGDDPATPGVETNVERGAATGGSGWRAGEWHQVAATWDGAARQIALYIDGRLVDSRTDGVTIPAFSGATFTLGADQAGGQPSNAAFDEVRISTRARSAGEIAADYETARGTTALAVGPAPATFDKGDRKRLTAAATSASGGTRDVTLQAVWSSSDPAVAGVGPDGAVTAVTAGSATITATLGGLTATRGVTVADPLRPTAVLGPVADIRAAGGTALVFDVTYTDDGQIKADTLNTGDVWVGSDRGYYRHARLTGTTPAGNGSPLTATYEVVPAGGVWDWRDNGRYTIRLTDGQVGDTAGTFAAARVLGDFEVQIDQTGANDAPSFTAGPNVRLQQESPGPQTLPGWATNISPGPANEGWQTVTFEVTGNTNAGLFAAGPAVSSDGTLTYTPAAGAHGYATITLRARDDGGTLNGGQDASPEQTFRIGVNPINAAPTFTSGTDPQTAEDSGLQTLTGWATGMNAGSPFEADQLLHFEVVSNSNPGLFTSGPTVAADGTLTFTVAPDANGSATIGLVLKDDGGTLFGGQDTSTVHTVVLTVTPVNDPPTFVQGANPSSDEDAGPQTVPGWATNIAAGPANEAGQGLTFELEAADPTLFVDQPAVSADGTLTYRAAPDRHGSTTVTVRLRDDAGGQDVSADQTFTITVRGVNDVPVANADPVAATAGRTVRVAVLANDTDVDGDLLTLGSVSRPSQGTVRRVGNAVDYTPTRGAVGADTFTYQVSDGHGGTATGTVSVTIVDTTIPTVKAVRLYYGPERYVDLRTIGRSVLPWAGVSRIDVEFSEPVVLGSGALSLTGARAGAHAVAAFGYDAARRTARWDLATPAADDRLTLRLTGAADASGNVLSPWARTFSLLTGDFDGNGVVTAADASGVKKKAGTTNPWADVDGNGIVDAMDEATAKANKGHRLR